jgi:hypothetical protein
MRPASQYDWDNLVVPGQSGTLSGLAESARFPEPELVYRETASLPIKSETAIENIPRRFWPTVTMKRHQKAKGPNQCPGLR